MLNRRDPRILRLPSSSLSLPLCPSSVPPPPKQWRRFIAPLTNNYNPAAHRVGRGLSALMQESKSGALDVVYSTYLIQFHLFDQVHFWESQFSWNLSPACMLLRCARRSWGRTHAQCPSSAVGGRVRRDPGGGGGIVRLTKGKCTPHVTPSQRRTDGCRQ